MRIPGAECENYRAQSETALWAFTRSAVFSFSCAYREDSGFRFFVRSAMNAERGRFLPSPSFSRAVCDVSGNQPKIAAATRFSDWFLIRSSAWE